MVERVAGIQQQRRSGSVATSRSLPSLAPTCPACHSLSHYRRRNGNAEIGTDRLAARSTDPADYQRVPRPVAAMAKDFADGHHIAPHSHERAQLIFAADGVMLVSTDEGSWAVPPQRAVWMPAGVTHEIRMAGAVAMRTLYVRADAAARLPARVLVIAVSAAAARADPARVRAARALRRARARTAGS